MSYTSAVREFLRMNPNYENRSYSSLLMRWAMYKNSLIVNRAITDRDDYSWRFPLRVKDSKNVLIKEI